MRSRCSICDELFFVAYYEDDFDICPECDEYTYDDLYDEFDDLTETEVAELMYERYSEEDYCDEEIPF